MIDLDAAAPAPSPVRRWHLRPFFVFVAFVPLILGGSAAPGDDGLPELWSAPLRQEASSFTLSDGGAFVLDSVRPAGLVVVDGATNGDETPGSLAAYEPRTGAVRWQLPVVGRTWIAAHPDGVILLMHGADRPYSTRAVDERTGKILWEAPDAAVSVATEERVLLVGSAETRIAGLRDGRPRWSAATAGHSVEADADNPAVFAVTTGDGHVTTRSVTDGRVIADGRIPWTAPTGADPRGTLLSVFGSELYAEREGTLSAYDQELRQLWSRPTTTVDDGFLMACGPVICRFASTVITGYDRVDGAVRWELPGSETYSLLTPERLLTGDGAGHTLLVDTATGRKIAELGQATAIGSAYALTNTYQPDGGAPVATLDPATGALRPLGTIPATVTERGCDVRNRVLFCVRIGVGARDFAAIDLGPRS